MIFATAMTLTGLSILSKAYWNTYRPELTQINVPISNQAALAENINVLQLSDIHVERLSVKPKKIRKMIGDTRIDLIALTGDYVDRVTSIDQFMGFLKEIMKIPTRFGVYAVWGNHDWVLADDIAQLKAKMVEAGVHVLENEHHTLYVGNDPIHLIGIDDHYSGHSDVNQAFKGVPEKGARFILTHDPLVVHAISERFDYLIAGHFHNGQIYYPLPMHSLKMGLRPFKKYLSGLQQHERGTYYISGGLGQTGANLRLGCRPEFTIHTLQRTIKNQATQPIA